MIVTDEVKAKIHKALEAADGNVAAASKILDVSDRDLWEAIRYNADLRARWTPHLAERPSGAVAKVPSAKPSAADDAAKMAAEDAVLRQGLEKVGLPANLSQKAISMRQFHGKQYAKCIDIIGAGVVMTYLSLLDMLDDANKKVLDPEAYNLEPEDIPQWLDQRVALLKEVREYHDRYTKAALTRAILEQKKAESTGGRPQSRKPGFAPMIAIKGEKVEIRESNA